ncbi:hypothetical protein [Mucilaginibacter defluvii]|uniref:Uncharacterized protein n=1 Tax=Mucilaginibacter defluvii TaxID=1196019 RepID=A0ABP9FKE3_9SPHI
MRKTSGVILIVLSCLIFVFAIADRISYQKFSGELGSGVTMGFMMDLKGLLLFAVMLILAVFLFMRGKKLLSDPR